MFRNFSISPRGIIGLLEWGRVFLEGALSKGIYVSFSQWLIFGVSPNDPLLASPCFRQNSKYQPRYDNWFRERLQETPEPHGARTY